MLNNNILSNEKINLYSYEYNKNIPFPHIVIDGVFEDKILKDINDEIYTFNKWDGEKNFSGSKKKRVCSNWYNLPKNAKDLISYLHSPFFLETLEKITSEQSLIPDPYLLGGGIHSTTKNGFLKIHADFNWNKKLKLFRRLNLLLYLNDNWKDEYNGNLELWDKKIKKCEKSIKPLINRMVIFTTDDLSFHGQPIPLNCPENFWRNSIALYYYSSNKPKKNFSGKRVGTDYIPTRNDNFSRVSFLRRVYGKLKYKFFPNRF